MEYFRTNNGVSLKILILIIFVLLATMAYTTIRKDAKAELLNFDNGSYTMLYDSGWSVNKESTDMFKMTHKKSGSSLNMVIKELDENNRYKNIDEIAKSVLFNLENQNANYNLLYKNEVLLTRELLDGYEVLYETNNSESAVFFFKKDAKFVMFTFNALDDYFDILIDNVNNMVYSFNLPDEKYVISSTIDLNFKQPEFVPNIEISSLIGEKVKECAISDNNYVVYYAIPKKFELVEFDSSAGNYTLDGLNLNKNLNLHTHIYDSNIYEYMEGNLKKNNTTSPSSNVDESLVKMADNPPIYMYKKKYSSGNLLKENIKMIYEINRNHIFVADFDATNTTVPFDMINSIAIRGFESVAGNIIPDAGGMITPRELVWFSDDTRTELEHVVIAVADGFSEINYGGNLYLTGNYVAAYDEKKKIYKYEVKYKFAEMETTQGYLNDIEANTYKGYGNYRGFMPSETIAKDDERVFSVYKRDYVIKCDNNELCTVYEKVLFYKMKSGRYLVITVKGNDEDIDNDFCSNLANVNYGIMPVVIEEEEEVETEEKTQE